MVVYRTIKIRVPDSMESRIRKMMILADAETESELIHKSLLIHGAILKIIDQGGAVIAVDRDGDARSLPRDLN